jgi:hypothetical protein
MIQQVKQCAGCGAQMGARARVCPRCGRGSLFGELLWIAVLGVLLLGIGVMLGLVPLERPALVRTAPAASDGGTKPSPVKLAPRSAANRLQAAKVTKVETAGPAESKLAYAPCPGVDKPTRQQPSESSHGGPHTAAAAPCREADDSSQHPSVQPPPAAPAP